MQLTDKDGNVFGVGGLEITTSTGKPKIPVINTDITIGTTAIVGGVSGRLLYDNAGVVGETNNISWSSSTNILTLNSDVGYTTYNRTIASSSYPLGTLFTQTIRSISQINHSGGTNGLTIGGNGGSPIFRIWDNGNVTIQLNGTYVDAGYRLDVNGTTRIQRTLDLGSVGYAGTINLRRAGDGGITSQITQTNDVTVIHNYQGSGTELKVDNVTYFHVRGFANQYAARVMGNLTAVSGLSTALIVNNAISASANNDTLIGLDIAPTFNNGAFTGVSNFALRVNGISRMLGYTDIMLGIRGYSGNTLMYEQYCDANRLIISSPTGYGNGISLYRATNNVFIGSSPTDAGYKLDINGTIRAKSDTYIGYENIAAGSTYIQINPDKFNSKIIFNDFDGGTSSRGGILEMSTYKSRLTYGSYNWFYIGDSINPFMFYIAPSTGNFVLTRQNTQPTDAGYKLDVGGTAIIRGDLSTASGKNMLFGTTLPSRQTNSAQYPAIFVGNSNSGIFGETTTGYKGINLNANIVRDTSLYWVLQDTTQPGWIVGLNYETGFTDAFSINRSPATTGTAAISTLFQVKGNGNIQIGTTTDAGYKLDVNGTARISGGTYIYVPSGNSVGLGSASNAPSIVTSGYFTGTGAISTTNSNGRSFNTILGGQGAGIVSTFNGIAQNQGTNCEYFVARGNINLTDGAIDLSGYSFAPTIVSEVGATIKAFSSGLSAASNHYNLYLSGTAQNYIAGSVGIGVTIPTAKLQVNGSGNNSSTTSLKVQNSAGVDVLTVRDDMFVSVKNTNNASCFEVVGVNTDARILFTPSGGTSNIFLKSQGSTLTLSTTANNFADVRAGYSVQSLRIGAAAGNYGGNLYSYVGNASNGFYWRTINASSVEVDRMLLTTGGNLLIGTTTDTGYKLEVNGTGYFGNNLRVNGTITAATPTANTYICHIALTTDQVLASGADALLDFVDVADTNNWYDPTTKKFLPTVAGYYHIDFSLWFEPSPVSTGQYNIQVRKNGTTVMIAQQPTINNGTGQSLMSSKLVYFNGTTDYIDFTAYQSTGSNRNIWKGTDSSGTYATIHLLAV